MYTHDSHKNNFTIQMSYKWQKAVTWVQSKIVTLQQQQKETRKDPKLPKKTPNQASPRIFIWPDLHTKVFTITFHVMSKKYHFLLTVVWAFS